MQNQFQAPKNLCSEDIFKKKQNKTKTMLTGFAKFHQKKCFTKIRNDQGCFFPISFLFFASPSGPVTQFPDF